jgi:Aspartyl/Asparaginyl beta-hydroxylase
MSAAIPDDQARFDEFFFPLPIRLDIDRLRAETEALTWRVPLAFERTRQLGLHSFPGSTDPWYDGCRKQREIGDDADYTILHPDLKDTYIEEVFTRLPFRPFRARLMVLDPSVCYSIHNDDTPRYHIAVTTSPDARFVFVDRQKIIHIPADGRVYFVDTRQTHTAFNAGKQPRLHLVFGGPIVDRWGRVQMSS